MTCWKVAHVFALICAAVASAEEFRSEPADRTDVAEVTSTAGRSETDCALQCESLRLGCSATAFAPEMNLCLLSAVWNADFSAAASGRPVYRKQRKQFHKIVLVDGRRFLVIQQRQKGIASFQRSWAEYEDGFGDDFDFWAGLHTIHELTGSSPKLLRVEALTWWNVVFVCEYSGFSVGDASTNYTMTFASFLTGSSNATHDSLVYHKGMQFSTMDRDNDENTGSCSQINGNSGWWFKNCCYANPNGLYFNSSVAFSGRMFWFGFDSWASLQGMRLMLLI